MYLTGEATEAADVSKPGSRDDWGGPRPSVITHLQPALDEEQRVGAECGTHLGQGSQHKHVSSGQLDRPESSGQIPLYNFIFMRTG